MTGIYRHNNIMTPYRTNHDSKYEPPVAPYDGPAGGRGTREACQTEQGTHEDGKETCLQQLRFPSYDQQIIWLVLSM